MPRRFEMIRCYCPLMLLLGLAVTFFGSLVFAGLSFPHGYDWRYNVMSSLSDPEDNPAAYRIAAAGMTLSGVFLSLLGLSVRTSLQNIAPSRWTNVACVLFVLGGLLITISALIVPGHHALFGLPKAHAKFAQAGAFSFDFGMVLTLPALLSLPPSRQWVRSVGVVLVLVPVISFLLSRLLLPSLIASHPVHSLLVGSLAFWEWIGSTIVFLYIALIVLALKTNTPKQPARVA